ncbi:hypothetical protein Ththe16_1124 [Thermus thermophilus SG0.5JP17-16]|uniref:Uncharacterized protein n=1 Tax=Thermus thermophilus (strain SG0.5JP17-16) TaxID=762633 RepID=F6DH25_THETG|nr:hypothetical protein [Thermus thermophilus]AEG33533.1 hypothetical protein Ththe16_1124 [Thermus thermophilus SG0.5JP17-16]
MSGEDLLVLFSVAALEALLSGDKLFLEGTHTLAHLLHRPGLALVLPKAVFCFWGGTFLILTVGGLLAFRKDA